jgi:hypothetical protein
MSDVVRSPRRPTFVVARKFIFGDGPGPIEPGPSTFGASRHKPRMSIRLPPEARSIALRGPENVPFL